MAAALSKADKGVSLAEAPSEIKKQALELIKSQHIISIASSAHGCPWSAPVYYTYHGGEFYFFSKALSRHIKDALLSKNAAASIHFPSSGWSDIRGLQMEGAITAAGINKKSCTAFKAYMKRFRFISEIKKAGPSIRDINSLESAFNATWYKFIPKTVYYLDNAISFGFKKRIDL